MRGKKIISILISFGLREIGLEIIFLKRKWTDNLLIKN